VTSVASGAEARDSLARSTCDIVLVDVAMPGEDGYTFIRKMRADGLRQPAAALTAQAHETDRVLALESVFDVHIEKPVEPRAPGGGGRRTGHHTSLRELKAVRECTREHTAHGWTDRPVEVAANLREPR
jgi:CheY-like chemotaxis protein